MTELLEWWSRAISLSDYNTRVVITGTTLLGIAAGLAGVYLLLRKRALLGDAISHSTWPGVAGIFLWSVSADVPRSLPLLLLGAAISGSVGGLCVLGLRTAVRIREDAALGVVLSVFFGIGTALFGIVQQIPGGNAAGLESFIYGKAALMTWSSAQLIGCVCLFVVLAIGLFYKEFKLLCFDMELARSQGWPVLALDTLLVGIVVTVTIVGLQAVGLILVIALLVVPAASARFWSHRLSAILALSAIFGGVSCAAGTIISASSSDLPSGATIVLSACAFFLVSFVFGKQKGVIWSGLERISLSREQHVQHLLRTLYEQLEAAGKIAEHEPTRSSDSVPLASVAAARGWSESLARRTASRVEHRGMVTYLSDQTIRLTPRGFAIARQLVREHRLLEHFFLDQVQASEGQADLGADYLEHALPPEIALLLEEKFKSTPTSDLPESPHPIVDGASQGSTFDRKPERTVPRTDELTKGKPDV